MATSDRRKAYILLVIAGSTLATIFGLKFWLDGIEKPDNAHGCLKSVSGKTIIVLDHSELVPQQTKDEIVARTLKFVQSDEKVQVGDLVSVFTVSRLSKQNLAPIFSFCKQNSETNQLTQKKGVVEKNYLNKFINPLKAAVRSDIPGSTESPIAQAIIDLSLSTYLSGVQRANLLIFSDMIEHTKDFSMYNGQSMEQCISEYKISRNGKQEVPVLLNAEVVVGIIPRSNFAGKQLKCRDGFWMWFFRDNNGGTFEPSYLPG